jgi:hypothetical protein
MLAAPRVHAAEPGRLPWGSLGRLPDWLARPLAGLGARLMRFPGEPRVFVVWHPWQYPLAHALLRRFPEAELWFCVWDRFEAAYSELYHDSPRLGRRLAGRYEAMADEASLVAAISIKIAELEQEAGRNVALVPHGVESMPAPEPGGHVIAACLGYLTPRLDWKLLRTLGERMEDLTVLMIGPPSKDCEEDPDYQACRALPAFVWLGERVGHEVSRLILCADVGIVPYKVEPYNDAAAPHRILKYAMLGRRSITPELRGVATYEPAVVRAGSAEEWERALRDQAGARTRPDEELRGWALQQTSHKLNAPLWERLAALGIAEPEQPVPARQAEASATSV